MRQIDDKIRVLVVDDDEEMAASLSDVLEVSGFAVEVVHSGTEAIERAQRSQPECILMDIRMPGLNGVEAFREVKRLSPRSSVVFMTAYAASSLVEEAHHEGRVVAKPLDLDRLIELISAAGSDDRCRS